MSRDKANEYVSRAENDPLGIDGLLKLDDPVLERRFHPGNPAYSDKSMDTFLRLLPDFVEQLSHKHVTRQLVWEDYRRLYPDGYGKSQFYFHLAQNLRAQKSPTSALPHEPGKELFVDFAGYTLCYVDVQTGEMVKVQTFVSTLACTDYTFAICVSSQKTEDFIYALGKALEYYGGVPQIVVPDNLKAAVIKADKYEPVLNKALDDMGNHYGFVTIPCQPVRPKQKAKVENQVQIIYHRIYACLRNRQFFSLEELNAAVSEFLACHNQTRMQQRPYTREKHFHAVEKPALRPLPDTPYQMKRYAEVTVQQNGHVYLSCDKHYYSVPYTLIGNRARIIFTTTLVKVYVKGQLVATHRRDRSFGYTSIDSHLASNTLAFTKRSASYYKERAKGVSEPLLALFDMPGMASCWKTLNETHQLDKLSLPDGLELLLQSELDSRRSNRIDRLIRNAGFKQQASLEEQETSDARGIPAGAVSQLATGEYLRNGATIVISGPTGTGKSFLVCALGERACRLGYKVRYYTVSRLIDELKLARLEGHELKFFERMEHLDLLIIDDFGMKRLEGQQQNDFEQIIDDRYHKKSLILSSQLAVADWYGVFSNEMLAEACLDRIVHKSLRFELKGDSMRKKY